MQYVPSEAAMRKEPAAAATVAATTIRNDLRCEPTEDARTH